MENIPFKAGQEAEAKSFDLGYRGAWFRCKIREIKKKNGILGHISKYYDYPGEKVRWEKLYQTPPGMGKSKHSELILRPAYPPVHTEKQMPNVSGVSEVVIVCDSWKEGDLVDWCYSYCFWSGRITELLNDQEAQIELKPPPLGEGASYRVLLKDLRPSLDWSLDHGWTVPSQEGGGCCARLIKPINEATPAVDKTIQVEGTRIAVHETEAVQRPSGPTTGFPFDKMIEPRRRAGQVRGGCSTSRAKADSGKKVAEVAQDGLDSERRKPNEGGAQNYKRLHTNEAAIMDLEEYINKVKWLKKILEYGISSSSSQNGGYQWKLVEPHASLKNPAMN